MSIAEFCNREVVRATRDTTIAQAASLMRRHQSGRLASPVVGWRAGQGLKPRRLGSWG